MANFTSDNCAGVLPEVLQSLTECNSGLLPSYGQDALTQRAQQAFSRLFEREVTVALLTSGTAANCLALSLYTPPYGAVLCHEHAHIQEDEYGAPGLFTGGAQLIPLPGEQGKISRAALEKALNRASSVLIHPSTLSLTQLTESGTAYSLPELETLSGLAREAGLKVHMDGARFAGALATLGCTPAEMTWKRGIDVLSFGGTKNGCLAAEAVIVFDTEPALKEALLLRRKKAGHALSKMRFIAAQFLSYLEDDLWLKTARHSNAMAQYLASQLTEKTGIALHNPVQGNEVFALLPPGLAEAVLADGHAFYDWQDGSYRFVTSFATARADIDQLVEAIRKRQ